VSFDTDDRWSDNAPACPYCGGRVSSMTSRECRTCSQEGEQNMKIRDVFPSNYLKAGDLQGRRVLVLVDRVEMETLGQGKDAENKPIVYFQGKEKGLVLNVTNMNTLVDIAGGDDETDNWHGLRAILYESKTQFGGKMVPCLRLDQAPAAAAPQVTRQAPRPSAVQPMRPLAVREVFPAAEEPGLEDFEINDGDVPF
jgi:hypothetical protein